MNAVFVELFALALLAAAGWLLVPPDRGGPWRLALALPLGVAAQACTALVLLATHLPIARPWVAAVLALVLAGVAARRRDRAHALSIGARGTGPSRGLPHRLLVASFVLVGIVVLVTTAVPLVNATSDSFRYLTVGQLLAADAGTDRMSAFLLQSRGLVVGAVHGLALPDLGYLRALGPLLAASTLGALWLLVREGLGALDARTTRWVAAAAVLLVLTNHRFLHNALLVNGHLLFAVWLLLLAAVAWRRVLVADGEGTVGSSHPAVWKDAVVAGLLAVGLTVLRPEGALVASLALAPVAVEPDVPRRWRQVVLVAFGSGIIAWHLVVVVPLREHPPNVSLLGMVALGVATVLAAGLLSVVDRWRVDRGPVLVALHLLLWGAVAMLALDDASILVGTVKSVGNNVVDQGGWGSSLLVLAGLLVAALLLRRVAAGRALLFPLLSFVPLAVLLNYARGGPGREGPGDSLNRMLLHLLPLAVLVLALAADSRPRRWGRDRATEPGADRSSAGNGDQHAGAAVGGDDLDV